MKRSLKELIGYRIEAENGENGTVKDFLFDEKNWIIRYLKADLGTFLPGRKVHIPKGFLKQPDWITGTFPVELSKEEIEKSPLVDDDVTVSRKYEKELNKHFKIIDYWSNLYIPPSGLPVYNFPPRPITAPNKIVDEKDLDTFIRSFKEVKGYHIQALNGEMGHIEDLIIEDSDWQIVYAVVDTRNWLPWSKKVLISINHMESISYVAQKVNLNINIETIKEAPEFDYSEPINEAYEKQLYDYYGRPVVQPS
ncbi:MAG: PRC-barrel domain-containing protein [Lutibacter sp.]|nr:PRC-barrel domain-containing protein [Lutibacter sp.]